MLEMEDPNLSTRSKAILKSLVELYIAHGLPVGSKTIANLPNIQGSSATIRNAMADLEKSGMIHAPHTSAGRVPTKKGYQFFLSNNVRLALNLNLDGAYIPSFNKDTKHLAFSIKKKFLMLGSAHNNKQIKLKERQLVKIIFLSSIFKKNKNYLGINKFKLLAKFANIKVVALGGISNNNIKKLNLLNCFGFAGISYFE